MSETLKEFALALSKVKSATIVAHMRPDGDTLGSALSLSVVLRSLGIRNEVVCESVVPDTFLSLPGAREIKKEPTFDAEAIVCVDCSDENRTGALADWLIKSKRKKFNIDHHVSNTRFGDYNYVRTCSANCQNMAELYRLLGAEVDKDAANLLMVGLLTDSGSFTHSDVDAETMRTAAFLLERGADISALTYHLFRRQRKERFLLNTRIMAKARFALEDRLAFIAVTQDDLAAVGAKQEMTEGFVDYPLTVDSVEVSIALLEVKKRTYKVSLRSKGTVNVNEVASCYGGGGHVLASGCMVFGELEEVIDKLTYTVSQRL